jgi:cytochrome o ubiquinol oxidase subunit 3
MSTHTTTAELAHRSRTSELGFWLYIMSDMMLFAAFFATYLILKPNTNGGVSAKDIMNPSFALVETLILLLSSVLCGLAYIAVSHKRWREARIWLGGTILCGIAFLSMEIHELGTLFIEGHRWASSGFLSGFFSLVMLHGMHIFFGIIWAIALGGALSRPKPSPHTHRRFTLFAIFWHFLDIVWIFIFTIVYLMGVL